MDIIAALDHSALSAALKSNTNYSDFFLLLLWLMIEKIPKGVTERLKKLKETIEKHRHLYHTLDAPEISDEAYDSLISELEKIEEKYPTLKTTDSPSERVGG